MITAEESFSESTKREIAEKRFYALDEMRSLLSALVRSAGSLVISHGKISLILATENSLIPSLADEFTQALYEEKSILNKSNRKSKRVELTYKGDYVVGMLADLGILSADYTVIPGIPKALIKQPEQSAAYVKGAFLGAGSVMKHRYHLEFVLSSSVLAEDLIGLLLAHGIASKLTVRKDKAVVYLKDSESISDCLALMGANKAVLALNNQIAERQLGEYVNRTTNCEIYNLEKQVNASVVQQKAIRYLLEHGLINGGKLLETARARLNAPDASYEELAGVLGISKSGVKHRLLKLIELAKQNTDGGADMIFKELEVKQIGGVTNQNAQTIVQRAMRYDSEILFEQGTRKINAKSLMGVLSMGLRKGDKVMVIVKGDDQDEALSDIALLFEKNFKL